MFMHTVYFKFSFWKPLCINVLKMNKNVWQWHHINMCITKRYTICFRVPNHNVNFNTDTSTSICVYVWWARSHGKSRVIWKIFWRRFYNQSAALLWCWMWIQDMTHFLSFISKLPFTSACSVSCLMASRWAWADVWGAVQTDMYTAGLDGSRQLRGC